MRHLHKIKGITDGTKEYVMSKCKHDANFVVRMVCDEVEKGVNEEQIFETFYVGIVQCMWRTLIVLRQCLKNVAKILILWAFLRIIE